MAARKTNREYAEGIVRERQHFGLPIDDEPLTGEIEEALDAAYRRGRHDQMMIHFDIECPDPDNYTGDHMDLDHTGRCDYCDGEISVTDASRPGVKTPHS